jgi:triacylglycerol lipase
MELIRQVVEPVGRVATALRRPATYAGHAREAASAAVTAGMWPFGVIGESWPTGPVAADPAGHVHLTEHGHRTPVLLVHGFGANRSNWTFLARHLRAAGFDRQHAINYNPFSTDLPHLGEVVAARIDELRHRWESERVHVIGHSLGGVIARYAVQVLGAPGVDRCITVASPHGGVRVAGLHDLMSGMRPFATGHQLSPDSPFMVLMRSSARPLPTRFVAYYSNLDLIVPARRAMIIEPELAASNRHLKDHGHFSILLSRTLGASVARELAGAELTAQQRVPGVAAAEPGAVVPDGELGRQTLPTGSSGAAVALPTRSGVSEAPLPAAS